MKGRGATGEDRGRDRRKGAEMTLLAGTHKAL